MSNWGRPQQPGWGYRAPAQPAWAGQRYGPTGNPWGAPPAYQPFRTANHYAPQRPNARGGGGCGKALLIVVIVGLVVVAVPIAITMFALVSGVGTSTPTTTQLTTTITTGAEPTRWEPSPTEPTIAEPTTAEPTIAEPTTAQPTTAEPTPEPTPEPPPPPEPPAPPPPPPTRTHPDGSYVNDGYTPPVGYNSYPPYPNSFDDALWWRTNHAIYGQHIGSPVRCALPPISEYAVTNDDFLWNLNAHLDCLMGAWHPPMANIGLELPKPTLYLYWTEGHSPCGSVTGAAGFYCTADNGYIYVDMTGGYTEQWRNDEGWITYALEVLLAHEFGHHVQARTGILFAGSMLRNAWPEEAALEENRRLELQVQCLAGMYINAAAQSYGLTESDRRALIDLEYGGDSRTHGLGRLQSAWFAAGLQTTWVEGCNTYTQPSDMVA